MKLNIDETTDQMRSLTNRVLSEFDADAPEEVTREEWHRRINGEYLFLLACEMSCVRCPVADYDTAENDVVADALRAWLRLRVREILARDFCVLPAYRLFRKSWM